MTPSHRFLLYLFAYTAIGIIVLTPVAFTCTLIWPYDVLAQFEVTVDSPVIAGELMRVHVAYDKRRDWSPTKIQIALVDGISIGLPFDPPVKLPMGVGHTTILVPVHDRVPPGLYTAKVTVFYEPFSWKTVSYTAQTVEPVEVIK